MIFCKASEVQVEIHLKQPVHLPESVKRACLWNGRLIFPITLFGQASIHFQQALHFFELRVI